MRAVFIGILTDRNCGNVNCGLIERLNMVMTLRKLYNNRNLLTAKLGQRCADCEEPLQETITGKHSTRRGQVCSDCYYEELGKSIERSPIVSMRVRRG